MRNKIRKKDLPKSAIPLLRSLTGRIIIGDQRFRKAKKGEESGAFFYLIPGTEPTS